LHLRRLTVTLNLSKRNFLSLSFILLIQMSKNAYCTVSNKKKWANKNWYDKNTYPKYNKDSKGPKESFQKSRWPRHFLLSSPAAPSQAMTTKQWLQRLFIISFHFYRAVSKFRRFISLPRLQLFGKLYFVAVSVYIRGGNVRHIELSHGWSPRSYWPFGNSWSDWGRIGILIKFENWLFINKDHSLISIITKFQRVRRNTGWVRIFLIEKITENVWNLMRASQKWQFFGTLSSLSIHSL